MVKKGTKNKKIHNPLIDYYKAKKKKLIDLSQARKNLYRLSKKENKKL